MLISANIFQPLIDVFEAVLKFFNHSLGLPWGWAIILLTVCVRLALMPLMLKIQLKDAKDPKAAIRMPLELRQRKEREHGGREPCPARQRHPHQRHPARA